MNIKAGYSFSYKTQKVNFKYEYSADDKVFFVLNAGSEKVV